MRNYMIAGNWKMNMVPSEAKKFAAELVNSLKNTDKDVIAMIAPPFTALQCVSEVIKGSNVKLGAQNINDNEKGAFTGAQAQKIGSFEIANGGTIFLDEIANLPVRFNGITVKYRIAY